MTRKNTAECFVLMPFAKEFDEIYQLAIKPAVQKLGFNCYREDEIFEPGRITDGIFKRIYHADILIVDVSRANPNVFYELGVAHTLAKNVILIAQDINYVPFDIRSYRVIVYDPTFAGIKKFTERLSVLVAEVLSSSQPLSPVLDAIPKLDTVPRSEVETLKNELDELQPLLRKRELEIQTLKSHLKQDSSILLLGDELKKYIKTLTEEVAIKLGRELAEAQAEINKLEEQNKINQSAQLEVRRLKQMTLVNPHWKGRDFEVVKDLCFLLMPFREPWSDDVWKLLENIVTQAGFKCERADEKDGRIVMDDIWEGINRARFIIADLTGKNPNVTYEVGLADVLGKDVILLSQTPNDIPFDFLGLRLITYENNIGGVRKLTEALLARLTKIQGKKT